MPTVNGYGNHGGYSGGDQQSMSAFNGTGSASSMYEQPRAEHASSASSQPEIPKDEVGWYFVEQYYTTLSRSPEKLYLFYNKRSQFVSGQETDKVPVCVGQRAINDRIRELDYHDCKVRVTNVDSQASDQNIVIQVIGEISNKSQPHKKFTQTFVLATQTNGYFVLNDIFRYLVEEDEEPEQESEAAQETVAPQEAHVQELEQVQQVPAAESGYQEPPGTAEEVEPKTLSSSMDPKAVEHDARAVDQQLEEKVLKNEEPPAAITNGDQTGEDDHVEEAEQAAPEVEDTAEQSAIDEPEQQVTSNEQLESEKPQDPVPSPAPAPAQQATPTEQPAAPSKPAAPKTWASLAASAARVATPAASSAPSAPAQPRANPAPRPSQPQQQSQTQPQPQPQPQAQAPAPTTPSAPTAPAVQREEQSGGQQDEWTAVGGGHNRHHSQSRQNNVPQHQPQDQGEKNRGYIKNVHEGINFNDLEAHLKQFGELTYFDIARQKNCAFVDFKTPDGYQAAVAANPHQLGNDKLFVEERRMRPGSTPYIPNRGPYSHNRGRGDFRGGRGGFPPRGRGAPRGARGGTPQAA
ncbi:hypothetical protein BAUCODRAFT_35841 [Baudoinia panamericana UAMH 10762]|uniref:NTF2 domain-containing protein n=1 Tax=Baudoinia panamericana (strain UAMH 10762) TaxID=717646 RepID=M2LK43_BAUPA|nr:uncharacterized protein BAUCODRAFT_35841 [Baudoinia panamericana UAMH 10762]EMC94607.1 hypothetical protein BAUCODRAFT_35841 [Baudoinia panamericana UAMH 10762]